MSKEIFAVWAPDDSRWSPWVKPVLFAQIRAALSEAAFAAAGDHAGVCDWSPAPGEGVAVVLDLPGEEGVAAALALARRGYRPVPLYNALPLPLLTEMGDGFTSRDGTVVDVEQIMNALQSRTLELAGLGLPSQAPPTFLLDANRHGERGAAAAAFDNRSVSFPTDFPSGEFLLANRIKRILFVQKAALEPQPDIAQTLRGWQEAGLLLERLRLEPRSSPQAFTVARPPWYALLLQNILFILGGQRAPRRGFGLWMPAAPGGG